MACYLPLDEAMKYAKDEQERKNLSLPNGDKNAARGYKGTKRGVEVIRIVYPWALSGIFSVKGK